MMAGTQEELSKWELLLVVGEGEIPSFRSEDCRLYLNA